MSEQIEALVDPAAKLTRLGDGFIFTEGPVWRADEAALYFSDLRGDTKWRWTAVAGMEVVARPNLKGNGMTLDSEGSLLVCEHVSSAVVRIRHDGSRDLLAFHYEGHYLNSPNDIVTRGLDGSIYFTDPDYGRGNNVNGVKREKELDFQGVYRVSRDRPGAAELLVEPGQFLEPNGLCLSPDEKLLYINDTVRGTITVFDVKEDGLLGESRLFASGVGEDMEPLDSVRDADRLAEIDRAGRPDGMKCDENGNIWVTGPKGVWVFSPRGEHLGVIDVPEPVGNLAWGGPDWHTLFLASTTTVYALETKVRPAPHPSQSARGNKVGA